MAAAGEWQDAPAVNWFWQNRDDQLHQVTADMAQVFLGVRLQCAKCHHHPYERWGQADYYGLAGFFTRLGRKSFGEPPPYYAAASRDHRREGPAHRQDARAEVPRRPARQVHAGRRPAARPRRLDGQARQPVLRQGPGESAVGPFPGTRPGPRSGRHARDQPAVEPGTAGRAGEDFTAHKFDVKHVIRTIVNSRVYQLSAEPTDDNKNDRQNFARFYARRLVAEVFLDAVDQACGTKAGFSGVNANARAVDLPHEGFGSYFLDTFDRPRRVTRLRVRAFQRRDARPGPAAGELRRDREQDRRRHMGEWRNS